MCWAAGVTSSTPPKLSMASLYSEDVFRAPDPRMSAQLGVKRVASLDGGQLRCLAGRRMIGVDISAGCGYTVSGSVPPRAIAVLGIRALNFGECFFFHMPDVRKMPPRHLIDAPAGGELPALDIQGIS